VGNLAARAVSAVVAIPLVRVGIPTKRKGNVVDKGAIDPRALAGGRTVQVSLPASVAFDLDRFQEVQRSILDKLGCGACCSGWDIRFDLQRQFLVDEKLNIREPLNFGG
jgi:hypothetical protein